MRLYTQGQWSFNGDWSEEWAVRTPFHVYYIFKITRTAGQDRQDTVAGAQFVVVRSDANIRK
jgi:hypothetical protein